LHGWTYTTVFNRLTSRHKLVLNYRACRTVWVNIALVSLACATVHSVVR